VAGTGAATDDTTGAATGPASAHAKGTE